MNKSLTTTGIIIATFIFLGFLFSYPVMLLWNGCLVGAVSGVTEITWLQSWGILILSNCLFKSNVSSK